MSRKVLFAVLTGLMVAVGGFLAIAPIVAGQEATGRPETEIELLEVEVAEDVTKVVFDEGPVFEDGYPAHGNPFITQGYIYPKGTLDGTNGVIIDEEGHAVPEFPDKVIGTWVCYGRAIGDGAHAETGAWAVSTQVFQFNEAYDNALLVTSGYESLELNAPVVRAITGGAGSYLAARGQATQELFGMTADMGVNLRFTIELAQQINGRNR